MEAMRVELAALRRQVERDSSNSSQPPSQNGPGAKAKARAEKRAQQEGIGDRPGPGEDESTGQAETRAKKRKPGGQRGHRGSGLARVADPQRHEPVEPTACGGCGAGLAGAPGEVGYRAQVFDLPTFALEVTEYLMMRRVCGCGQVTTAEAPLAGARRTDLLRPAGQRSRDLAGIPGRDRHRTGRGHDVRTAGRTGLHRVRLLMPGPPGRRLDHRGVRRRTQGRTARTGRARHRRNPGPADHHRSGRRDRRGLQQPAGVHRAHPAHLHPRMGRRSARGPGRGSGLVRRGRHPHEEGDHRVRDPPGLPRGPGPRRLRWLRQLRQATGRSPTVPVPPTQIPRRRPRHRPGHPTVGPSGRRRPAHRHPCDQHRPPHRYRPRPRPHRPRAAPAPGNATTTESGSGSRSICPGPGTRATTPAWSWRNG